MKIENGETPADVTLIIGSATFPMTALGQNQYAVVLTIPDDLPTGVREYEMVVSYSCGAEEQATEAGEIVLIDPSGQVTDMTTGQPITSAIVTLYRVPDALPDTATETRDCRTVDTRGGNNWSNLPAASLDEGIVVNPELGLINGSQEISPTVNPLTTGNDGRYAWDVVEGCWYVAVEAEGYHTLVSPVVGVPPEVTDLDMALNPLARPPSVYLPIVVK